MEQGTVKNHGRHHAQQAWPRRPGISRIKHALRCLSVLPGLLLAHPSIGLAATLPDDLTSMGLEALMNIEVTSVAKKPQKKSEAAAAVFVITSKDLRRWGVTNIPDALRRVPGLQVARIDANKWAITSRGFNSRFANKLLVLIDGRTVYTPLFAGVYWDANLVMLEDVEQIEIIRGPGGTLWGANAVTGSGSHYRLYAMSRADDSGFAVPGAHDDSEIAQAGFRTDWSTGEANSHTLQGDYYRGTAGQELLIAPSAPATITDDADTEGGNLLYRWTHRSGDRSDLTLQAYVDYVGRESAVLFEDRYTLDLELQHHFAWNDRHDVVWGLNYRSIDDDTEATQIFSLAPAERRVDLITGFIQDEIGLFNEHAKLTLGTKLEHNDFTGFEVQPNIRLAWLTDSGNTVWGAVSRAVRTPARGEHDVSLTVLPPPSPPGLPPLTINGNSGYDTEKLVAWEIGLRRALADSVTLDATAFYNRYDELRTIEITSMPPGPFTAIFDNNMEGNTQGFEIDVHWQARSWLSVNANYTRLEIDLDLVNGSMDTTSLSAESASPEHQANLWIAADLDNDVHLDAGLRYVDSLQNPGFAKTGDYLAFDARLAWKPAPGIELSLVGQNLFDNYHPEFNPDFIISTPSEVERSVHGTVSWTFR